MLVLIFERVLYTRQWHKGFTYRANFSASVATEGHQLQIIEELENKKFLPLPWVYTKTQLPSGFIFVDKNSEPISGKSGGISLFAMMSYTAIRHKRRFICNKRGFFRFSTTHISISNLFHTKQFAKDIKNLGELIVYPRTLEELEESEFLFKLLDTTILSNRMINPDPFEFRGIRDYQPTDPLNSINFKASAVSQSLMVNIFAPTIGVQLNIILGMDSIANITPNYVDVYENAIRVVSTLAQRYILQDVSVSFLTNGRNSQSGKPMRLTAGKSFPHLNKINECLALINTVYYTQPLKNELELLTDKETFHLIISPAHEAELIEAVYELNERGLNAFMIVPVFADIPVTLEDSKYVTVWRMQQ